MNTRSPGAIVELHRRKLIEADAPVMPLGGGSLIGPHQSPRFSFETRPSTVHYPKDERQLSRESTDRLGVDVRRSLTAPKRPSVKGRETSRSAPFADATRSIRSAPVPADCLRRAPSQLLWLVEEILELAPLPLRRAARIARIGLEGRALLAREFFSRRDAFLALAVEQRRLRRAAPAVG